MLDKQWSTLGTPASLRRLSLRAAAVLLALGVNLLYIPINRMLSGGILVELPFDRLIPLWPIWSLPYVLALPWWTAALIWAAIKMDNARFKTFIIATLLMTLSSYAVYILFPTYVERPQLVGDSWDMQLMRLVYGNDRSYCALPSGHTYYTTLIAAFWWSWHPRQRWLWAATVPVIILATLFTRQHNTPDVVFGLLWAFGSMFIASRITGWNRQAAPL